MPDNFLEVRQFRQEQGETSRLYRLIVIALTVILTSCTSFQGPGDLHVGNSRRPAQTQSRPGADTIDSIEEFIDEDPPPELFMRGKKTVVSPEKKFNFDWPVLDARLERGFIFGKRPHKGIDLSNKRGTPILASESGTVIYAGSGFRGYGKLIVIEHGDSWATFYAHLDKFKVKEGAEVKQGDEIGAMGKTGRASGYHLHFEIRFNREPKNPLQFLPQGQPLASDTKK